MFLELTSAQLRQQIDSASAFGALARAQTESAQVRGFMFWRTQAGGKYLIRSSEKGRQTSLGPDSDATRQIYDKFTQRKARAAERLRGLKATLQTQTRLNRALRVGRAPAIVIDTLNALADAGVGEQFLVIGTPSLYAYETAAGVRIGDHAAATQDIDLLFDTFDTHKRLGFLQTMQGISLIDILRRADKTFRVREDQAHTAVNASGFEIDVTQRLSMEDDPHPMRMNQAEDDFWAVQISMGSAQLNAAHLTQTVIATNGKMATMRAVQPLEFARIKRALAKLPDRDPLKRRKDRLQADVVDALARDYLQGNS